MNIGDYVRNQFGIGKIIDIKNNNDTKMLTFDKPLAYLVNIKTGEIKENSFTNYLPLTKNIKVENIKHSFNIIDLIEVGDILKFKDSKEYQEVIDIDDNKLYTTTFIYNDLKTFKKEIQKELEWVITHEQIEKLKYKINGDE